MTKYLRNSTHTGFTNNGTAISAQKYDETISELYDESAIRVESMQGLLFTSNPSDLADGSCYLVQDFYSNSTGGGDPFFWDATGDKAGHDGIMTVDPTHSTTPGQSGWWTSENTGTTGVFRRIDKPLLNVKDAGAKGDGANDDYNAIQAAIDYVFSQGPPFEKIFFPSGTYLVSQELDRSGNGNYIDLQGEGRRKSIIKASASMSSVLFMAEQSDVTNHTTVSDLSINANNNAGYGIDAENMRYWTLQNVEIQEATTAALRAGNWVTRILNNRLHDSPIGLELNGRDDAASAANDFVFAFNDINTCPVGVSIENRMNDVLIEYNSFDLCENVGVWAKGGGRKISINKNFFERCGLASDGGAGVSVPIDNNVSNNVTRLSAIIIGHIAGSSSSTTWTGQIKDNIFVNSNETRYVVLTNVRHGTIKDNAVHDDYSTTNLVEILGFGCFTTCKRCEIRGSYGSEVDKLVLLNGNDPEDSHRNMIIGDDGVSVASFAANDPTSSEWTGGTTINTSAFDGIFTEFEYDAVADGTNTQRNLDITLSSESILRGKYLRIQYQSKGSSTSTGVWVQVFVDSVEQVSFTPSSTSYTNGSNGSVIYIPDTATSIQIRTRSLSSSDNAKMTAFSVCDASYDFNETPIARLN